MYIVFEGIVGTGKSTLSKMLYEYLAEKFPKKRVILTREPGGNEISEAIRILVQGTKFEEEMHPITTMYLYAAGRAQSIQKIIKPVLKRNGIVISDRSFVTSLAYQGHAEGLGIENVLEANIQTIDNTWPDIILYGDLAPKIALKRVFDKGGDRWETRSIYFFEKVRQGYEEVMKMDMFKDKMFKYEVQDEHNKTFEGILKILKHKKLI